MINIKNIYYMLAYAFNSLNEDGYKQVSNENFDNTADLLAEILSIGISQQIKRGLGRSYIRLEEELQAPKGKINISESIKSNTLINHKLVCDYDEFSVNSYPNQILKSTMLLLIRCPEVKQDRRKQLKKLAMFFAEVDEIDIRNIRWTGITYDRNNASYKMLIYVCYLVIKGLLISSDSGVFTLAQFANDKAMSTLYEKFILEYYRRHYPWLNAEPSFIEWNLDDDNNMFLPKMRTDITLTFGNKVLIIDAKYYAHSMQQYFDRQTVISGNLYQIYTYVKNKDIDKNGNVAGMLLYAKTDDEITPDFDYSMDGNKISARSLDLDCNFEIIKNQLNSIADSYFGEMNE